MKGRIQMRPPLPNRKRGRQVSVTRITLLVYVVLHAEVCGKGIATDVTICGAAALLRGRGQVRHLIREMAVLLSIARSNRGRILRASSKPGRGLKGGHYRLT